MPKYYAWFDNSTDVVVNVLKVGMSLKDVAQMASRIEAPSLEEAFFNITGHNLQDQPACWRIPDLLACDFSDGPEGWIVMIEPKVLFEGIVSIFSSQCTQELHIDEECNKGKKTMCQAINIIFDGPPGPHAGRFVEVETDAGKSICAGVWIPLGGNFWKLRITELPQAQPGSDDST